MNGQGSRNFSRTSTPKWRYLPVDKWKEYRSICFYKDVREKGRDLTQPYDRSPYNHRTLQKAK